MWSGMIGSSFGEFSNGRDGSLDWNLWMQAKFGGFADPTLLWYLPMSVLSSCYVYFVCYPGSVWNFYLVEILEVRIFCSG